METPQQRFWWGAWGGPGETSQLPHSTRHWREAYIEFRDWEFLSFNLEIREEIKNFQWLVRFQQMTDCWILRLWSCGSRPFTPVQSHLSPKWASMVRFCASKWTVHGTHIQCYVFFGCCKNWVYGRVSCTYYSKQLSWHCDEWLQLQVVRAALLALVVF